MWADLDPRYVEGQRALGRDVSEFRPEIRVEREQARYRRGLSWLDRLRMLLGRAPDGGWPDG